MPGSLEQLVEKLRKALDGDLVSIVLYGSAAVGDHNEKFSDYNVLCVLSSITPSQLAATEPVFRWWCSHGNPSPLLLTEQEVHTSTDCFPIEFYDIRQHNRILDGADIVSTIEIDRRYHRAQVEHELRSKLLRLRQKAAGVLSETDVLRRLLVESVSTFCVLFKHALILSGVEGPPAMKRDIIALAERHFGLDAAPFASLLDLRERKTKPQDLDPQVLLPSYLNEIGKVINAVDKLETSYS